MTKPTTLLDDQQLLGPSELGVLLGRATKSIRIDIHRRPESLPPRFVMPGTKMLKWRVKDVREWLEALAEVQATERAKARGFGKRIGAVDTPTPRPFHLGDRHQGVKATNALNSKDPTQ